MPTYLERYLAGEREMVWADLVGLGEDTRSLAHFDEASRVAAETMRRTRLNVEVVRQRLLRLGYAFLAPDQAHTPPGADTPETLAEIERLCGLLPLSLRAFYEVVGAVDFRRARDQRQGRRDEAASELYALGEEDPLVVAPLASLLGAARAYAGSQARRVAFTFAPDEFHKANYSGGDNYHLWLPNPDADFRIEGMYGVNDYFVAYLRATFASGGFRGRIEESEEGNGRVHKVAPGLRVIDALASQLMPL